MAVGKASLEKPSPHESGSSRPLRMPLTRTSEPSCELRFEAQVSPMLKFHWQDCRFVVENVEAFVTCHLHVTDVQHLSLEFTIVQTRAHLAFFNDIAFTQWKQQQEQEQIKSRIDELAAQVPGITTRTRQYLHAGILFAATCFACRLRALSKSVRLPSPQRKMLKTSSCPNLCKY